MCWGLEERCTVIWVLAMVRIYSNLAAVSHFEACLAANITQSRLVGHLVISC